jgi:hypothetical protein
MMSQTPQTPENEAYRALPYLKFTHLPEKVPI